MADGRIEIEVEGAVGWLILANEERRNAMSFAMYQQVPSAVRSLLDQNVRCIVVRGRGSKAFGAGSNIAEFSTLRMGDAAAEYNRVEDDAGAALRDAPVPVLAMIHGACRGGGLAIALCCDLRVAAEDASFAVPPAKLGVGYPFAGTAALVHVVGEANARRLLLTAETVDAATAQALGLVHEVTSPEQLGDRIGALTGAIVDLAPLSLAAAKASIAATTGAGSAEAADAAVRACYDSADYQEGIRAFLAKESPRFTGT